MCTYDLKYSDYNTNVSDGLRSLLATSDISDITLAVEGKFFKAHQVILSIFSPYFRELFCVNPSKHTIFFMKNVKYRIMHNLLAFMYEGMVQIPEDDFNLFWETANELKIKGLSNDAEPHSRTKSSQVPVESAQVVGIDGKQSTKKNTPILSSYLKRPAESVQTSPAGAARKKSKVGAPVQLESVPEVNVLASAVPSTSWNPAPIECVQEDLPIIVNVKKEADSYAEENIIHFMQNEDAIDLDIKMEPEEVRHLGVNEGHSVPYQTAPKENILPSAGPSTSWHPAPRECADEVLPIFVNVTGDTNVQTRDEVDSYSEDDTTYCMQNEDSINPDGSGGDNTFEIKWEREDAPGGNLLDPLCEANAGQHGDNMIFHAEDATNRILPDKSKERYEQKYSVYCTWRNENDARRTTEDVFVAYLTERSKHITAASLWSEHSMLKTMIKLRENVDVKEMLKVQRFLKQNSKKYTPKISKTFTEKEFIQFLKYAPDEIYLMMKTALIIGIYGACKRCELANLEVEHVNICDGYLVVTIQQTNHLVPRTFTVPNSIIDGIQMAGYVTRYISLRPAHTPHKRLFIFYSKGKCTTNPVGINTFGKIPANVATFLNLPEAKLYTGNCIRRTSATLLANAGAESKINISKQILQPGSDSD